jgi:hypothetical protein
MWNTTRLLLLPRVPNYSHLKPFAFRTIATSQNHNPYRSQQGEILTGDFVPKYSQESEKCFIQNKRGQRPHFNFGQDFFRSPNPTSLFIHGNTAANLALRSTPFSASSPSSPFFLKFSPRFPVHISLETKSDQCVASEFCDNVVTQQRQVPNCSSPAEESPILYHLDSVLQKRRHKMNKHKRKKRRKMQRALLRRLGKI